MKISRNIKTEFDVVAVRATFPIRYPEDFQGGDDFPGRSGDSITMTIDLTTGAVHGWPPGRVASLYEKVCDEGSYSLLDGAGNVVVNQDGYYVPGFFPGDHYGDYIIADINADGRVHGWRVTERAIGEWVDSIAE